jgi:chromosome segregation ATPase
MNDKERLEAIKKKFSAQRSVNARAYESLDLYDLSYEEGDWLIEQAEKASRLELEIEYWKSLWEQAVNEKAEKVEQLQKQLERKEQALEEMFQNRERWRISHGELEAKQEEQHQEIEQLKDDLRFRLKMLQKQEKDLMKVCEERDGLKQQLQQAQEWIEELEYLEAAVQSSPYEDYFWKKIQEMKASEETK